MRWIPFTQSIKKTLVLLGVALTLTAGSLAANVPSVEARSHRHYQQYRQHRPYYQQRRYYRSSRPYAYRQRRYYRSQRPYFRHHRYDRRYR